MIATKSNEDELTPENKDTINVDDQALRGHNRNASSVDLSAGMHYYDRNARSGSIVHFRDSRNT